MSEQRGARPHEVAFYRDLLDSMSDGVYFVDPFRNITYWSRGAERMTGYRTEDVLGHSCRDGLLNHVDDDGQELCGTACPLLATIRDGRPREAHVFLRHAAGHRQPVWVRASPLRGEDGQIIGAVEVFSDDTAAREAQDQLAELEQLALLDPLTGLGNRRYLERQLAARIQQWSRYGLRFGVLIADIDLFKQVNDVHGHYVGDETLSMVARTISFGLRQTDVAVRYGGEEFVIVVQTDRHGLDAAAERLRSLVESSRLAVSRVAIDVTISLGGAVVGPGDTAETLLRRADLALYAAKQAGRNRFVIEGSAPAAAAGASDQVAG